MRVQFDGLLVKVSTKRAKTDKDGQVLEEPAIAVTVEVPVSAISPSNLGALLRAMDRQLAIDLTDGQRSFDVIERELVAEPSR